MKKVESKSGFLVRALQEVQERVLFFPRLDKKPARRALEERARAYFLISRIPGAFSARCSIPARG